MKPEIIYQKKLPNPVRFQESLKAKKVLLLYDQRLLMFPAVAAWISGFDCGCSVVAGEELKSLTAFQAIVPKILRSIKGYARDEIVLVAMGGGSVGDFGGFLASVLKRGVRLVHFPTTWLAAIDSSHGGKTALNVAEFKNQIGTFYQAERIVICKEVLDLQGEAERCSALGEFLKMALISGGRLFSSMEKKIPQKSNDVWQLLPLAIDEKYKIVRKDPFERKNLRHVLNLGHTLGHAYELSLHWPHGIAVFAGTRFAVRWSAQQKLLSLSAYSRLEKLMTKYAARLMNDEVEDPRLRASQLRDLLLHDKKAVGGANVRFVFLSAPGRPQIKKVLVDDVICEAVRQGVV